MEKEFGLESAALLRGQARPLTIVPDIEISECTLGEHSLWVVREDRLPGGTKQRACIPYLESQSERNFREFVYASPFAGFAQVALASAARELGLKARIFCEISPWGGFHEFSRLAESFGAEIFLCHSLPEAEERAADDEKLAPARLKVPLGFDCPEFRSLMDAALKRQWRILVSRMPVLPKRVWVSLGSGTLTGALRRALPAEVEICAVDVHVLPANDLRIDRARRLPNVRVYSAPESFADKAIDPPHFDSNIHYDAKVWRFVRTHAESDDVWWNVAR